MAFSSQTIVADGVTVDFSIPFDYLDPAHIRVSVDKVFTTEVGSSYVFEVTSPTTVRVTDIDSEPVPSGSDIKIVRKTPIDTPAVIFGVGASLSTSNLNKNSEYLTFALQEATDANEEFTKLYLGSLDADPATDNEGETLKVGAVYYNSVLEALFYWTGTEWIVGESTAAAEAFKDAAEAASAVAVAARDTAVAARTAAQSAQTVAQNAETTAVAAAASATADQASATAASAAALASESAAASSAASALVSSSSAGSSATVASTSAANAATSEGNASTSETNAASSASSASSDAAAAAASAAAAAASEANAASSAADAAASASSLTFATEAEARDGLDNTKVMTPLRTAQAIDEQSSWKYAESVEITAGGNVELDFTISTDATEIEVLCNALSVDTADDDITVQVGDGVGTPGVLTSGYDSASNRLTGGTGDNTSQSSYFHVRIPTDNQNFSGKMSINRLSKDSSYWSQEHLGRANTTEVVLGGGRVFVSGGIAKLRVSTRSGVAFDFGRVNVRYR